MSDYDQILKKLPFDGINHHLSIDTTKDKFYEILTIDMKASEFLDHYKDKHFIVHYSPNISFK